MNTQEQIAQQIEAQTAVLGQSIQGLVNRCEVRQERASKFYDRDESMSDLRYELENAMRNGLAGRVQFVPTYTTTPGGIPIERTQHVAEAVIESLDHMETAAAFWDVLKSSTCPMVQALREHICKGYSQLYADEIAEARGI